MLSTAVWQSLATPSGAHGSSGHATAVQVWTLVVAGLAVAATVGSALSLRRTGKEQAAASKRASRAAEKAATAATTAAEAAEISGRQLDEWRQREESMRMLRWAVDKTLDPAPAVSSAGQVLLDALRTGTLVQTRDVAFIDQVIHSLVADVAAQVDYGDDVYVDDGDEGE